jgi:hypothetical protein
VSQRAGFLSDGASGAPVSSAAMSPQSQSLDEARRLRQRLQEIDAELRDYPQPIARCDAQLGGLIEERYAIRSRLEQLDAPGAATAR